jgi:hypothetical protein
MQFGQFMNKWQLQLWIVMRLKLPRYFQLAAFCQFDDLKKCIGHLFSIEP